MQWQRREGSVRTKVDAEGVRDIVEGRRVIHAHHGCLRLLVPSAAGLLLPTEIVSILAGPGRALTLFPGAVAFKYPPAYIY